MITTREELLQALYGADTKKELLAQFEAEISVIKGTKSQKYTQLLEQIIYFSHAIIYGHKIQTAHNYRQDFMTTAKKSNTLKLDNEDIEKAFSFLNRTEKKSIRSSLEPKPTQDKKETPTECIAIEQIQRLSAQLEEKSYQLKRGQKAEDTEIYIKVALIAMATGSRLQEITETLELSRRGDNISFTVGEETTEGIILKLDYKAVRGYIKDIRKHYADRIKNKVDISTGIRKAVKRLEVPNCGNLNHLNALYKECLGN